MGPTIISAIIQSAVILLVGFCPTAKALQTGAAPADPQKWWLIKEAKSLHASPVHDGEPGESLIENLHAAWENKQGKGFPTFSVRRVDFQKPAPAFEYMFPVDESDHQAVHEHGIYEPFVSYHLGSSLKECCKHGSGHFLDIGAKYGWYSLLSASHGCAVDSYEPVPWYQSMLSYNQMANLGHARFQNITMHPGTFLGASAGERRTMVIPTPSNGGAVVMAAGGAKEEQCDHGAVCIDVTEAIADEEMKRTADLESSAFMSCGVRVNAEGSEPEVLRGAWSFITNKMPKVVILEVHPGMQKTVKLSNQPTYDMLASILELGYVPYLLNWETVRTQNANVAKGSMKARKFSQPIPELLKACGVDCIVYLERAL